MLLPSTYAGAELTRLGDTQQAALPPAFTPARPHSGPFTIRAYAQAAAGRLVTIYCYSKALHKKADYLVYVPEEYKASRPLPVFYMLHGMPGRPLAFTVDASVESKLEALIREHLASPMILVFPDGRIDGNTQSDSEWANTPSGRFESYVVNVVHDVDGRFATRPCRQDRAIAGLPRAHMARPTSACTRSPFSVSSRCGRATSSRPTTASTPTPRGHRWRTTARSITCGR